MELDPYEWLIIHKDGKRHSNADAMSRIPVNSSTTPSPLIQPVSIQTDYLPPTSQTADLVSANVTERQPTVESQICLTECDTDDGLSESTVQMLCTSLGDEEKGIAYYQKTDALLSQVCSWVEN